MPLFRLLRFVQFIYYWQVGEGEVGGGGGGGGERIPLFINGSPDNMLSYQLVQVRHLMMRRWMQRHLVRLWPVGL